MAAPPQEQRDARPAERRFGPASRQTRGLVRTLRRSWLPVARNWRMTPRGIHMLRRITEPGRRVPVLRGTVVEPVRIAGLDADWVRAPRAALRRSDRQPVFLYIHGGGFVFGSPRTHRNLISRLSHVTSLPVLAPDYRMAPEADVRESLAEVTGVYRELLGSGAGDGEIVVGGDSAGGNLALGLALDAVEEGLPPPAALVLLSPWTDLTISGDSIERNGALDPFIPVIDLHRCARVAARGADPADWRVSPLFAPERLWAGLPPALVQVGSEEVLYDDAARAARRIAAAGVRAELQVFDRQPHVTPLWTGTPEARTAVREIGRFVAELLGPEQAPPPSERDAAVAAASQTDEAPPDALQRGDAAPPAEPSGPHGERTP